MRNFLILVFSVCLLSSCIQGERVKGSGNVISETRDLVGFKAVQLMGSMDVIILKADNYSVQVEADDNLLPYIETYLDDTKLKIRYKNNVNIITSSKGSVKITVSMPVLEGASVLGSGNIEGEGVFSTDAKVKLQITGSGDLKLTLDAPAVEANITGSGDMELNGNTKDINCSTTGSGTIKAAGLKAENAGAQTAGSGNIQVFGSVRIDARITGSGDIRYTGGGTVSSKITGSGSVKSLD